MKYLILILIFASCNSQSEKAYTINVLDSTSAIIDSVLLTADSIIDAFDDFPAYVSDVKARINKLEKEKKTLEIQLNEPQSLSAYSYETDNRDKIISELKLKLKEKDTEIATLKKKISSDSAYRSRPYIGQKLREIEADVLKPDDKSLVITLDKKIRGDGEIADNIISVYIMPYNKKSKKLREYGNCDMSIVSSLGGIQASYYEGQYFFNGIEPGEYLIKVCSLFGNWKKIDYNGEYQTVAMKVAPPIQ